MNHHLDQEVVAGFISEAKGYLPEIMLGLEAFAAAPEQHENIKEAYRFAHIIKGAASMLGFLAISELAYQLEIRLEMLSQQQLVLTQEMLEDLCQNVGDLSDLLDTSLTDTPPFSAFINDLASEQPLPAAPAAALGTTDFEFFFPPSHATDEEEKGETHLLASDELEGNILAQTPPSFAPTESEGLSVLENTQFAVSLPEIANTPTVGDLNLNHIAAELKESFGHAPLPPQPEFQLPDELLAGLSGFHFEPTTSAAANNSNLLEVLETSPSENAAELSGENWADENWADTLADNLLATAPTLQPEPICAAPEPACEVSMPVYEVPEPSCVVAPPTPEAAPLPSAAEPAVAAQSEMPELPELLPLPELPDLLAPALLELETFPTCAPVTETSGEAGYDFDELMTAAPLVATLHIPTSAGSFLASEMPEELLETFLLEAEEHLQIMQTALRALEKAPGDIESLQEIRRSAHSLKGTASLIGFRNIMQLAHRMEDLLDLVYEEKFRLTPEPTHLLMRATDMLEDMSNGQINEVALQQLYAEFEEVLAEAATNVVETNEAVPQLLAQVPEQLLEAELTTELLAEFPDLAWPAVEDEPSLQVTEEELAGAEFSLPEFAQATVGNELAAPVLESFNEPLELAIAAAATSEETAEETSAGSQIEEASPVLADVSEAAPIIEAALPFVSEVLPDIEAPAVKTAIMQEEPSAAPTPANTMAQTSSQFLRVPIEQLDEVVKLIGEMMITRTSFEQRLADFAHQVEELQIAGARLRRASTNLESKYEVSTLGGGKASLLPGKLPLGTSANGLVSALVTHNTHGFDELEFDRYTEFHLVSRELVESSSDIQTVGREFLHLNGDFLGYLNRQSRIYNDLQDRLMRLRMVPLASIAPRLHRAVRQVSTQENKLVELTLEGEATAIDTTALQDLVDPLLHLLRNAVDHGIEMPDARVAKGKPGTGQIKLRAFYEGSQVILQLSDDGRGLDSDKIRAKALQQGLISAAEADALPQTELWSLIFTPGFSTASHVSEISGRGVGMDVVQTTVQKLKGTITIDSRPDAGVTFTLRLPLTLAVARALMVKAHGQSFAIPLDVVTQIMRLDMSKVERIGKEPIIRVGGKIYPLLMLSRLLNLRQLSDEIETRPPALLINVEGREVAVIVDQLIGGREIVIKTLGTHLRKVHGVMGATLMGSGDVVLILNLAELVRGTTRAALRRPATLVANTTATEQTVAESSESTTLALESAIIKTPKPIAPSFKPTTDKQTLTVMVVDDSPSVRRVSSNLIKNTGWIPVQAKDGLEALEKLQSGETRPDLMMLDIEMPRMDGYQLLTSLRALPAFRHLPVVMVSSRSSEKHRQKAFDLGATDYLVKPYQEDYVVALIRRLVENNNP